MLHTYFKLMRMNVPSYAYLSYRNDCSEGVENISHMNGNKWSIDVENVTHICHKHINERWIGLQIAAHTGHMIGN